MSQKVSIRFFNNREVRAAWDDSANQWLFSIADIVGVLTESVNPRKILERAENSPEKVSS
jgi:cell filamentation protein